eukprot:jgi/Mesen1/6300/ME000325S05435
MISLICRTRAFVLTLSITLLLAPYVDASVTITTEENATFSFADADAAFGGVIPAGGMTGVLHKAVPLDACAPLKNSFATGETAFVLIERGGCVFDLKVRYAQLAGFSAVVVFNDEHGRELITMSARSAFDIYIPAVFVTNNSGKQLLSVIDEPGTTCVISPSFENTAWSVMAVSFISLLAVSAVLATFFFVRRHRLRRVGSRLLLTREPAGMSARDVKALPCVTFKAGLEGGEVCLGDTCVVCLEDYEDGEKLRVLPCRHEFHVPCIDQWLTTRRPFCPVCKRDARDTSPPPPSMSSPPPPSSSTSTAVSGVGQAESGHVAAMSSNAGAAPPTSSLATPLLLSQSTSTSIAVEDGSLSSTRQARRQQVLPEPAALLGADIVEGDSAC